MKAIVGFERVLAGGVAMSHRLVLVLAVVVGSFVACDSTAVAQSPTLNTPGDVSQVSYPPSFSQPPLQPWVSPSPETPNALPLPQLAETAPASAEMH